MRRTIIAFAAMALALVACGFSFAQEAQDEPEWQEFVFQEETVYRMPDAVMRELGFDVPEIPDERNAAIILINAILIYQTLDKGIPLDKYDRLMNDPWTAEEFPEAAEWLERNGPAFDLLDQAIAMDEIHFPLFLREPDVRFIMHFSLTPLTISRDMARALKIRANLHAGEGRTDHEIDDAMRIVELGYLVSHGQGIINSLVGVAINAIGTQSLQATLSRGGLIGEELAELQDRLDLSRHLLPDPARSLKGEMRIVLPAYDQLISGDYALLQPDPDAPKAADDHLKAFQQGRVWKVLAPNRTLIKDLNDHYASLIEYALLPAWERGDIDELYAEIKPYNIMVHMLSPVIGRFLDEHSSCDARYDALIQGVAILRYLADHGEYPAELNALLPDYLGALPPDPFTGDPFGYIVEDGGFVVYSVGMNRVDEGGRTHDDWPSGDDIVFRIKPDQAEEGEQ